MSEVTQHLDALDGGDPSEADRLLPLVYDELRRLAAQKLAREGPGQTLQATALVHEAYVRLVTGRGGEKTRWANRAHFFSAAAEAMRRILIENGRRKKSLKRGGDLRRHEFHEAEVALPELREDIFALSEALDRLAATDMAAAKLVKLRFFAGLTAAETAEVLGVSLRTVDRLWSFARAWLYLEMQGATPTGKDL